MNFIAKRFIAVVGLLYLALVDCCSVQPEVASKKVGFETIGGSGKSEFMTIYGGLELGIALLLLATLFRTYQLAIAEWVILLLSAAFLFFTVNRETSGSSVFCPDS